MTEKNLTGKNILITGASRGLGSCIARTLRQKGANLLLTAATKEKLAQLNSELSAGLPAGQKTHVVVADLKMPDAASIILAEARKLWDRLDVLVNNAAILGPIGKSWENDWAHWQETLRINLLAPIQLCRACLPWMIEKGRGKIINLSGGGATGSRPNFSAYATAKTGLVRFSEILAHEVYSMNIQVNCVAPGALNTDMTQNILSAGPAKAGEAEYQQAVRQKQNGGTSPQRAADLCAFLASPAGDAITGKLISAVWDSWEKFPNHLEDLKKSDIYTLRRIVPKDRDKNWE